MPQLSYAEIVILVAVTIGAVTDMITKKIYNVVTFPTAAIGFLLNTMSNANHLEGFMMALSGWFLATFIMVLPNPGKKIAFGDVKMMGAVGACLGWVKMLICMFYFSLTYGLIALILIARAIPKDQIKGFWLVVKSWLSVGVDLSGTVDTTQVDEARKAKIPIGPAIALGTYLGVFFDKPLMHFLGFNSY
ncbi:MAG: prepilin peptidase [Cyanobacteria bacterium REEB67]|nr:prepilin peptidase [Cyanobacteria bacterium REEB67]